MRKHSHAFSLKKVYILGALFVLLAVLIVISLYYLIHRLEFADDQTIAGNQVRASLADDSEEDERPMISYNGDWYEMRENLKTVLLMGLDKFEADLSDATVYRNNQQTDFMLLLIIDPDTESYSAIHLNRDTMTNVPTLGVAGTFAGYRMEQITLAHTYGSGGQDSGKNSMRAVSEFLYGMDIQHYITVTMDAVAILNDSVGGVTVTLEDDFTFADPKMKMGETLLLDGNEALIYLRARKNLEDSSNLHRMSRQRTYLDGLFHCMTARSEKDSGFLSTVLLKINDYLDSDCTISELNDIAEELKEYAFLGIEDIPGEAVKGETFMEFYADDAALTDMLVRLFYKPCDDPKEN